MRPTPWFSAILASAMWTDVAFAEVAYALDFQAPPECPPEQELRAAVERRSDPAVTFVEGARFSVRILPMDTGFEARTVLPDGETRTVEAPLCADVLNAVAFIVVVALESQSKPPLARPSERNESLNSPEAPAAAVKRHTALGATVGALGSPAPAPMPVAGIFVANSRVGSPLTLGARGALLGGKTTSRIAGVSSSFTLISLDLDLCPVTLAGVSVCAGIEAGTLGVSSELSTDTTWRFWSAARGGLRYELVFGSWVVELTGGAMLPVARDRFVVERADGSETQLHRAGFSGFAAGGLGHRL